MVQLSISTLARLTTVKAEFIEIPESPHHDMPLDRFSARLRKFLFQ